MTTAKATLPGQASAPPSGAIIATDIPARLDRLRWGRFHTLVVVALGITWILDGLEVTLAGAIAPALKESPLAARPVGHDDGGRQRPCRHIGSERRRTPQHCDQRYASDSKIFHNSPPAGIAGSNVLSDSPGAL